jgi:competence protein ComEC
VLEESYSPWYRYGLVLARSTASAFKLSFWVWLITCPLVWSNFHIIAPIAIPLNVLIAAPLVVSLLSGLMCGLLGGLPPVGWIAGLITGGGLETISWLIACGKHVTLGHIWLPAPPTWWIVCFYTFTALWLVVFGKHRRRELGGVLSCWILVGIGLFSFGERGYFSANTASMPASGNNELRCTFLDVGHGTSVIIEHPSGEVWLYDAGHLGAAERSHQDIAAALWNLPTARLDKLIISHADADHYNATLGLLERFNVATVISTQRFWKSTARDVISIRAALNASSIQQLVWNANSRGNVGQVSWQVLHPDDALNAESDNASSLCLLLEYAGKRVLLPGDLEGSGLLNLVSLPERPCHALMAPHHGSLTHDPSELLTWCQPEVVVISGNHRAVRPEVLEQYARPDIQLGITFRDNAIQIRIAADGELSSWHWVAGAWAPL